MPAYLMRTQKAFCWCRVLAASIALAAGACAGSAHQVNDDRAPVRFLTPSPTVSAELTQVASDLNRQTPHFTVSIQPMTGSVPVTSAIQTGAGEFGVAQSDVVYLAYRKGTPTHPYPHSNLRGVALGALNRVLIFVRRDGPIHRVEDLRGHRVAISPEGTAGALLAHEILEAHGVALSELTIVTHQAREMGRNFDAEKLDAMIMVGLFDPNTITIPVSPTQLRLIPIDGAGWTRLRASHLFLTPTSVPAQEMAGLSKDVPTIGAYSVLICRRDLPEELVYQFIKALFKEAETRNPLSIDQDAGPATPIPLHPGAARYYRELQLLQ